MWSNSISFVSATADASKPARELISVTVVNEHSRELLLYKGSKNAIGDLIYFPYCSYSNIQGYDIVFASHLTCESELRLQG